MCKLCYKNVIDEGEFFDKNADIFTDQEYSDFINGVYEGTINKYALPDLFYTKTAFFLQDGLKQGLQDKIVYASIGSPDHLLTQKMTENTYFFSAAKTYQQTIDLTNAMFDDKGLVIELEEFIEKAKSILVDYNEVYLAVERNMALAMGRGARDWQVAQEDKEFLPLLQYETVGDKRVRPEHARLDNITKPVDDAFWNTYFPPNGWRCRCTTLQLSDKAKVTKTKKDDLPMIDPIFAFNPGVKKIVYSPEHPYFNVPKEDKELKANNFGLKPIEL